MRAGLRTITFGVGAVLAVCLGAPAMGQGGTTAPNGAVAIECFISSNPSPLEWLVSGPKPEVDAVQRAVLKVPGAEVIDRASGSRMEFASFRLPAATRYGDFMAVLNEVSRYRVRMSVPTPAIPTCPRSGRSDEIDDPYASPVVVGIFGEEASLAGLRKDVPWPSYSSVGLKDGTKGFSFRPRADQIAPYEAFVADAAAGKFGQVRVALLLSSRGASE